MTYNLMHFKLSMLVLKIKYPSYQSVVAGWPMTLNSVGDCLEDTTLHTVVHKFQSERGVHVHPPAPPLPTGLGFYRLFNAMRK